MAEKGGRKWREKQHTPTKSVLDMTMTNARKASPTQLGCGECTVSEVEEKENKCWYRRMICSKASNYRISYEAQVELKARGAHEEKKKGKGEIPILVLHAMQKNKVERGFDCRGDAQ